MKIKSIQRLKLDKPIAVYDISVYKNNNFILANGVVVHNSKDVSDCLAGVVYNCVQWMRNPKRQPPPAPSAGYMSDDVSKADSQENLGEDGWVND